MLELPKCKAGSEKAAQEGTYTLLIKNQTQETFRLQLIGPNNMWLTINPRANRVEVAEGTYRYIYTACGRETTGLIKVKRDNTLLFIERCKNAAYSNKINFRIYNNSGDVLRLNLYGDNNYYLTLDLGLNRVEILAGTYDFRVAGYGCGGYFIETGTIKIKNGDSWRWRCVSN